MIPSIRKILVLVILLLSILSVLSGCSGRGGGGFGGGVMPAVPTGLTVTVSNKQIVLHWSAAAHAATYRVYYEISPGLTKASGIKIPVSITGTSYTVSPPSNNVTYYFIVSGVHVTGVEGPASAEIAAKLAAPGPPATVMAVASSGTGTPQVTIEWTGVNEATSYGIYRGTTSSVTSTLATGLTVTSYTDAAVVSGTTYYYMVRGQNAFGPGPASLVTSATPTAGTPATINVSGRITYEDKEYDRINGFTYVTTFKAVRFADVELVNAAGSPIISASTTTFDGSYSFSIPSSNIGTNMYVRVISSATPAASQSMNVKNWSSVLYAVNSATFALSGNASVNLAIPITSQADGAFNILDVMTSGFQFINAHAAPFNPTMSLNAFWQNDVSNGTYYCRGYDATFCPGGTGIYVLSDPFGSYDTDDFDDDVLIHEFGHFTASNFSLDDSMGGPHSLNGNTYDLRLTWSEGWGDFYQGAVKFWLSATDPSLISSKTGVPLSQYVDTVDGQAALIVDIGDPDDTGGGSPYCHNWVSLPPVITEYYCTYSTNEIAVANVLWNHMTGTGNYGMQKVWDVIAGFKPVPPSVVNLESFYDRWKTAYGLPVATVYTSRLIDYSNDIYEADDGFLAASLVTANTATRNHRLYSSSKWPGAEEDYFKFVATAGVPYTITTSNLRNGADTSLTLYNSTFVPFGSPNDNISGTTWISGTNYDYDIYGNWIADAPLNNTTNLASKIIFTPASAGTYYVVVTSSPNRPLSAGKYGSYDFRITSP